MYFPLERNLPLISLQINKHFFLMKSSENFALAKYMYHFDMLDHSKQIAVKFFKTLHGRRLRFL